MKFNVIKFFGAAGHALLAVATHLEATPQGATVVGDAKTTLADGKKTLADGANAAISYVKQGLQAQAANEAGAALTKLGIPAEAAQALGSFAAGQGEAFLTSLIPGI